MKQAAAEKAEAAPQAQLEAGQERLAQVEKEQAQAAKNIGEEGQTAMKEANAEEDEGHAQEDDGHAEEDEEDEVNAQVEDNSQAEEDDNVQEDDAPEESPIKRSARVYTAKKISPLVLSEPDIETMEVAPKQAELVVHNVRSCLCRPDCKLLISFIQKRVTRKDIKELGTNVIPCKTCAGLKIDCVGTEGGYVCAHCKRRKMACSLVPGNHVCYHCILANANDKCRQIEAQPGFQCHYSHPTSSFHIDYSAEADAHVEARKPCEDRTGSKGHDSCLAC
jgi:hypothetical protein